MRYFTKEWFAFCQKANPLPADIDKMNEAGRNYRAALQGQDIPSSLQKSFWDFHDCPIIGCETLENALVLRIENYDHKKTEIRVSFFDVRIKKQDSSLDGCEWLYSEIYRHYLGYEVHILFQKSKGLDLVELIIQCRDISITDQDTAPNKKRR